jgi:hypothetical protein
LLFTTLCISIQNFGENRGQTVALGMNSYRNATSRRSEAPYAPYGRPAPPRAPSRGSHPPEVARPEAPRTKAPRVGTCPVPRRHSRRTALPDGQAASRGQCCPWRAGTSHQSGRPPIKGEADHLVCAGHSLPVPSRSARRPRHGRVELLPAPFPVVGPLPNLLPRLWASFPSRPFVCPVRDLAGAGGTAAGTGRRHCTPSPAQPRPQPSTQIEPR